MNLKKTGVFVIFIFVLVTKSFTQDSLPPEYLVKQDFPDSVKNLSMQKLDGTKINFSDVLEIYKDKKVVVDIWASWCKDCIGGLPKLEKLKKKTGTDNVIYVFISVDEEEAKWQSAIERFNIGGEHYRFEGGWKNAMTNYIELDWIPRYLVLSHKGKIVMPKAITASDKELENALIK